MENPDFKSLNNFEKVKVPFDAPANYFNEFPTNISHLIATKPAPELKWLRFIRLAGLPIGFATIMLIVFTNKFQDKQLSNDEVFNEYVASEAIDGIDEFSFIEVDFETPVDSLKTKQVDL